MTLLRSWIVSVSSEHEDPIIYGPYTKDVAEKMAEKVREAIDKRPDDDEWMHATARPISASGISRLLDDVGLS